MCHGLNAATRWPISVVCRAQKLNAAATRQRDGHRGLLRGKNWICYCFTTSCVQESLVRKVISKKTRK